MSKYFTRHKEEFLEWHYRKIKINEYSFFIDTILIGLVVHRGELGWQAWDLSLAECYSSYFETRRMASLYLLAKQGYRTN